MPAFLAAIAVLVGVMWPKVRSDIAREAVVDKSGFAAQLWCCEIRQRRTVAGRMGAMWAGLFCFAITAFPDTGKQDAERVMHGDALKSLFILRPEEHSIDWLR